MEQKVQEYKIRISNNIKARNLGMIAKERKVDKRMAKEFKNKEKAAQQRKEEYEFKRKTVHLNHKRIVSEWENELI